MKINDLLVEMNILSAEIMVLKYYYSPKETRAFLDKLLILNLGQELYKMSLKHPVI